MGKIEHTPLPWATDGKFVFRTYEGDQGMTLHDVVAFLRTADIESRKSNAEIEINAAFITTACNAYYDLQHRNKALAEALELLHDNLAEYQRINKLGGYDNHDMKMARTALAANGGGDG